MTEQLMAGVELMLVGMGIVFLFLAMLIVAVNLMSTIVLRFSPVDTPAAQSLRKETIDRNTIAAISAAVHQYRSNHKTN